MSIRVLPPEVAARIAAGEVVERPASVVKELVENAIDANATRVGVEVGGGGLVLLRVVDNGSGMSPSDLELAFKRHATSKLPEDASLERIVTLGFRGEALPSIAAVSEVEAVSRPAEAIEASLIRLKGGEVTDKTIVGAPVGTSIAVRGLFSRHPARLKFLRSPQAEAGQIANLVSHFALAYPEVAFSLKVDGRETFSTSGSGDSKEALAGVYGTAVAAAVIEVNESSEGRCLEALAVSPQVTRSNRNYITVFINRRWVKSRSLSFAVEEAYRGFLQSGRFPITVANVRLPAEEVDVNVHPAKAEVRLRNEREVFALVQRPIRRALAGWSPYAIAPDGWQSTGVGLISPRPVSMAFQPPPLAQAEYVGPAPGGQMPPVQTSLPGRMPILRPLGQAGTTYVVAEGPGGLFLIDQHAAHERVVFEMLRAEQEAGLPITQGMLAPVSLDLTPGQKSLLSTLGPELSRFGFEGESFGQGGSAYLLRAVPALLRQRDDPAAAFVELLDLLTREDGPTDPRGRVAASIACHSAVRAGQNLAPGEMRDLLRQLEECDLPQTCPHGRPTMVQLTADELAKRFGRR